MSRSTTLKRAPVRRPAARRKPRVSIGDRILSVLPVSETTLHRIATWSLFAGGMAAIGIVATMLGVPGAVGTAIAEGIGRAGFRVDQIEVTGLNHADSMTVYADALDQKSRAMPLIDLAAVRAKLLARQGWIEDAHVSRRLPNVLLIHVVERKPSAIWQHQGQLTLIANNGALLEPVSADAMPDLPLLIGPGANEREAAYLRLLEVAPALKPQVKAGTWVGNRRWNLTFDSGETLALPEGDEVAAQALIRFAQLDGTRSLLGKGWLRFDMRDPTRLVARKPGQMAERSTSDPKATGAHESAPSDGNISETLT